MSHFFGSSVYPTVTFANLPTAATANAGMIFNVSDVGVNGSLWRSNGTKWAPVNGSALLAQNGMPFIVISSGSISSVGALTGITALSVIHPKAWIWLPANAVATVSTAGWRYCTFSTTTAGTVFLDQPATSFPAVWPTSPTAVSDGKGSYTGMFNSFAFMPSVVIPAGAMGINGRVTLEVGASRTGNNTATLTTNINGSQTAPWININTATGFWREVIANAGALAAQTDSGYSVNNGNIAGAASGIDTANTANALTLAVGALPGGDGTHNTELLNMQIMLYNDGQ